MAVTHGDQHHVEIVPNGVSGAGVTTHYWDCCKPSCSWRENIKAKQGPVASCAKDGVTKLDPSAMSACGAGGVAYMCNNQGPWTVNSTLAYGFAGASLKGGVDYSLCCACLQLTFKHEKLTGKKMIIQATNTGADAWQSHFDLAIPGGGVGVNTIGCQTQWNAPPDGWGQRYGGVSNKAGCAQLPKQLQKGCEFRFDWLEGIENPNVDYVQVTCPASIVSVSGCNL